MFEKDITTNTNTTNTTATETTKTTTTKTHKVIERVTRPDVNGFWVTVPRYDDDSTDDFMDRMAQYLGWVR